MLLHAKNKRLGFAPGLWPRKIVSRLGRWSSRFNPKIVVAVAIAALFGLAAVYAKKVQAPCDDGYVYLVYVKNLFNGNGLTYNGEKVQGFTRLQQQE